MEFCVDVHQRLIINDSTHRVVEHPAAPGLPFGQEGRQATVYQLVTDAGDKHALKVFKPRYRYPGIASQADKLALMAEIPGLSVCRRVVLHPGSYGQLLQQHPDLTFAVLMPWIEGPTWEQVVLGAEELSPEQSLHLARALAALHASLEEQGMAHCDLVGPNLLLPELGGGTGIELVDLEQVYGPGFERPDLLLNTTPHYTHEESEAGLWCSYADRFAGAMLLAEMLAWCDDKVREKSWGKNYFPVEETHKDTARSRTMTHALERHWGDRMASLFERAWHSETLRDCPTFGEWLMALPMAVPPQQEISHTEHEPAPTDLDALMDRAWDAEEEENLADALDAYSRAQHLATPGSTLNAELDLIIDRVERKLGSKDTSLGESTRLEQLFNDGVAAKEASKLRRARELLEAVIREDPHYQRGGTRATEILQEVNDALAPPWWLPGLQFVRRHLRILVAFGIPLGSALLALVLLGCCWRIGPLGPYCAPVTASPTPVHGETLTLSPTPTSSPSPTPTPILSVQPPPTEAGSTVWLPLVVQQPVPEQTPQPVTCTSIRTSVTRDSGVWIRWSSVPGAHHHYIRVSGVKHGICCSLVIPTEYVDQRQYFIPAHYFEDKGFTRPSRYYISIRVANAWDGTICTASGSFVR